MSFGGFDPAKQSGYTNRSKRFYLKEGSNIYRVLPPVKSLRDKNKIAQYWSVIWITDTKEKKRPVASILRKNKDVILQHDPLITKIEEMKKEYELALKNGASPAVVTALKEAMKRLYNKKVYALNVLSASGELGVLEIPYTSYQNLEQRIRELHSQGIDAIGIGEDKGVYFDFKKTKDERGRVVYPVDVATKTTKDSNGNFIITYIRAPISAEEAERLSQQAEDLTKLYRELSVDEMAALATMDQAVFDAIFSRPQKDSTSMLGGEDTDMTEDDVDMTEDGVGDTMSVRSASAVTGGAAFNGSVGATTGNGLGATSAYSGILSSQNNSEKIKSFLFPEKK